MGLEQQCASGRGVSALIAERTIATATVTANCRNNSPEMPGMNATGTNADNAHQGDRDDRRGDPLHASMVASAGVITPDAPPSSPRPPRPPHRIVHHDPDGEVPVASETVLAE
jgi:hypothetical protein